MKWVKTKKQLPENDDKVLALIRTKNKDFKYYEMGYYKNGNWWNDMIGKLEHDGVDNDYFFVSHWMPLPKMPK